MEIEQVIRFTRTARATLDSPPEPLEPDERVTKRKRPPKRRKVPKRQIVVRLDPDQIELLGKEAVRRGMRRSEVIRRAISSYLRGAG